LKSYIPPIPTRQEKKEDLQEAEKFTHYQLIMPSNLIRAGQFAQAARQGAIIVVALALPRLGIGREVIGEWESLLYVGYILGFGWLTGLLQAYLVQVRTIRPAEAAAFSRIAIIGVGIFSAILLAIAAGLHRPLFSFLSMGEGPPGWWYFFLFLLTQWPGLFFEQVLTIRGKPLALVLFGGFSALGFILSLLVPLYYGAGFAHAMFVLATFAGVKGLVIGAWLVYDRWETLSPGPSPGERGDGSSAGKPRIENQESRIENPPAASSDGIPTTHYPLPTYFATLLKTAWPLILYASIGALVTAFDPWFVNYWYAGDESIFATFRYGARELPLLAAITNGAMVVVLPRLTESPAAGLDLLKESSRRLYHWIFGGAIFLMATSGWWWTLVFTELFAESLLLFQAYLFVVVSRLLFPVPVLTALGHTRLLMVFGLLELAINVALSILLVPHFGLQGIIWATVIAYLVDKICLMAYLKYRTGIGPERYTDWRWFGGYVATMALVYLFLI
jgi:O-antigen/teichoic acid export membrane protein